MGERDQLELRIGIRWSGGEGSVGVEDRDLLCLINCMIMFINSFIFYDIIILKKHPTT